LRVRGGRGGGTRRSQEGGEREKRGISRNFRLLDDNRKGGVQPRHIERRKKRGGEMVIRGKGEKTLFRGEKREKEVV